MPTTYNKVTAGNQTLIDLSQDTVTQSDHIVLGYVGHLANGQQVTGTGGGGGTTDYTDLTNKPQINSVTLTGNKSSSDLGLLSAPTTAGVSGQVLTSNGQGGQSWQTPYSGTTVVNVTGSTPSITGASDTLYKCGTCSTISISVPSSGIIDVIFSSGSTATVLTVTPPTGKTIKWPGWFNPISLDINTTYEINIMEGEYGAVTAWT